MRPLFSRLTIETSRIYGLILASTGIPHQLRRRGRRWAISVSSEHRTAATKAINLYRRENPDASPSQLSDVNAEAGIRTYSALFVIPFLALIHWAIIPGYEHQMFVEAFGSDALQIMNGNLYRCVTALLLHKDWPHVLNNMVGLALFGTVAASICGWGMGWVLILLSGAAGNLATAIWYHQDHVSIGASTAVFGALGLCIAFNLWRHARTRRTSWRMWVPLAGGLALLGFLGSSPHSDLMAHLAGFGSGVVIGAVYGAVCRQAPSPIAQWVAAVVGGGIIALSCVVGAKI